MPPVALSDVVAIGDLIVSGATLQPFTQPFSIGGNDGPESPVLPGPSGGSSDFGAIFRQSLKNDNLDSANLDFLSSYVSEDTSKCYASAFRHLTSFADLWGQTHFLVPLPSS